MTTTTLAQPLFDTGLAEAADHLTATGRPHPDWPPILGVHRRLVANTGRRCGAGGWQHHHDAYMAAAGGWQEEAAGCVWHEAADYADHRTEPQPPKDYTNICACPRGRQ